MHAPREPLPCFIEPMLLEAGLPARVGDDWTLELKWDGLRAHLRVDGSIGGTGAPGPGRARSAEFPDRAELAAALRDHRVVLDGELVHLGPYGKPDFSAIS